MTLTVRFVWLIVMVTGVYNQWNDEQHIFGNVNLHFIDIGSSRNFLIERIFLSVWSQV